MEFVGLEQPGRCTVAPGLAKGETKKRLFGGSSETEAETPRESIITVNSGRLCSGPVPVRYAAMAVGQRE